MVNCDAFRAQIPDDCPGCMNLITAQRLQKLIYLHLSTDCFMHEDFSSLVGTVNLITV